MANDSIYFMQCVTAQAVASYKRSRAQAQPLARSVATHYALAMKLVLTLKKFCFKASWQVVLNMLVAH